MAIIIIFDGSIRGKKKKYQLALIGFQNNKTYLLMALTIQTNQFSLGSLGLIDSDSLEAVSASFSNVAFASSDESIFIVSPVDGDESSVKVSGVNKGEAALKYKATATYTDKFGNQKTKDFAGDTPVSVIAVQEEQNVSLVVNFGDPQNQ